jgi:serine/threonine protein kinase/tetratricopeptide (TPR) repeat protein
VSAADRTERRARDVFQLAISLDDAARAEYLVRVCDEDAALRPAVQALLDAYRDARTGDLLGAAQALIPPAPVGERIGPYRIVQPLGTGGMGSVYAAEREDVGLRVAIKLVRDGRLASGEQVRRFLLERRILARLRHPGIARLLDAGVTAEGLPYLVMEFVAGAPIDEHCARGGLGLAARARLLAEACEAVHHAHEHGVIHRDIKPSNLMIDEDGRARLVDFGVAKLVAEADGSDVELTRPGSSPGTPAFAAPEQRTAGQVSRATDVFALGRVLQVLIVAGTPPAPEGAESDGRMPGTARRAGPSRSDRDSADHVRESSEPRDLAAAAARLRVALEAVAARATRPDPQARYGSADELRTALLGALAGAEPEPIGTAAPHASRRTWPRRSAVATAAGVITIIGAGLVHTGTQSGFAREEFRTSPTSTVVFSFPGVGIGDAGEAGLVADAVGELLVRTLDGAAALTVVDPELVRRTASQGGVSVRSPADAAAQARALGAGLFVLGQSTMIGDRVRVHASLHSSDSDGASIAHARADGPVAEIFALVDGLVTQLIARRFEVANEPQLSSAVRTTASIPAFRAYLEGETLQRLGRFDDAVEAYRHAVSLDSGFALAHYRMANAATSTRHSALAGEARSQALRHANRLGPRDRMRLEAYHVRFDHGDIRRAVELYTRITDRFPDDLEATFQLADLQFHLNPYHGRPLSDARDGLVAALRDPALAREAADHLLKIAAVTDDRAAFEDLARLVGRTMPEDETIGSLVSVLRAGRWGTRRDRERAIAALPYLSDVRLIILAHWAGVAAGPGETTAALARIATGPDRPAELRAWGHLALADLAMARGRWHEAHVAVDSAAAYAPLRAAEVRAMYATLPYAPADSGRIVSRTHELLRWTRAVADTASSPPFLEFHPGARGAVPVYLLGVLAAAGGDTAAAGTHARMLESWDGGPEARVYSGMLAAGVRARIAAERADAAAVLRETDAILHDLPRHYHNVHFATQASERFLRAEALRALGRLDEAIDWYRTMEQMSIADYVYLAPMHLAIAEIHDRRGERGLARRHRLEVLRLWRDCDPELRPLRDEVERRAAAAMRTRVRPRSLRPLRAPALPARESAGLRRPSQRGRSTA